jgi:ATP-dependent RNA helicase DeaD
MARQILAIQDGAQVIVGTPGRVLDHLRRKTLDPSAVRLFVLDESDEMLSMGFLPQITEVMEQLPPSRQTLLFSATLPPDIQRVAETKLKSPEFITLSGDHIGALEINHFVYMSPADKPAGLLTILEVENPESAIVFCNTRDDTKRVASVLNQQGFDADWLNADLSQAEREAVMARTREGKLRFLVATDVAARGIDISHLTHVINFDFPESAEQYVHRTGRTGRAGRTGTAVSLIEPSDIGNLYYLRLTYKIRPLEKTIPSAQEIRTRTETDLVQSFVNLYGQTAHADDLALARRLLTHPLSEQVVAGLLREHLGARPNASEEASAARRAKAPRPVPKPAVPSAQDGRGRRREREPRPPRDGAPPRREREPRPPDIAPPPTGPETSPPPESEDTQTTRVKGHHRERDAGAPPRGESEAPRFEVAEVFVNVGRKDGARASDFYEALMQRGGVGIDDTDYVNVRAKNAFIGVRKDYLERAVEALNGAIIAGHEATAEPSRTRG